MGGSEAAKFAKATSLEAPTSGPSTNARNAFRLSSKTAHKMQQAHARAVVVVFRRGIEQGAAVRVAAERLLEQVSGVSNLTCVAAANPEPCG